MTRQIIGYAAITVAVASAVGLALAGNALIAVGTVSLGISLLIGVRSHRKIDLELPPGAPRYFRWASGESIAGVVLSVLGIWSVANEGVVQGAILLAATWPVLHLATTTLAVAECRNTLLLENSGGDGQPIALACGRLAGVRGWLSRLMILMASDMSLELHEARLRGPMLLSRTNRPIEQAIHFDADSLTGSVRLEFDDRSETLKAVPAVEIGALTDLTADWTIRSSPQSQSDPKSAQ